MARLVLAHRGSGPSVSCSAAVTSTQILPPTAGLLRESHHDVSCASCQMRGHDGGADLAFFASDAILAKAVHEQRLEHSPYIGKIEST